MRRVVRDEKPIDVQGLCSEIKRQMTEGCADTVVVTAVVVVGAAALIKARESTGGSLFAVVYLSN